ncbi:MULTISPECIES: ATP-binding protein [unclassified Brevibacterium]|uniref:ATP-binding protein n=1 Tax=unclassified Brevibacterium TaxID=2614124 RepID=UPI001092A955|nr:ATP-binding protein [Brevibacterium sp. S22]TGD28417.1 sensor histidine kinase [Brevibacterium sp. S22]
MPRPHRSFSRRVLISQLALVIVILALVTGVFAWIGARTVTEVTETEALSTARTLAIDPDVRAAATAASAEHADEPDEQLVSSMLEITDDLRDRSGISFAVITDDRGIRLTHPDRSKIGHRVSTSPEEALAGRENVSHESGTLGETVRAKVPIYSSEDGKTVVGEVSVGIYASVLDADVRRELILLGTVAVLALALGGVVSVMLGRRLRRETLGVGPEELAEMARDQGAVLHGLDDGVLGFDASGSLTLSNSNAKELLGTVPDNTAAAVSDGRNRTASAKDGDQVNDTVDDSGGTSVKKLDGSEPIDVPDEITSMMADAPDEGALRRRITIGDRILLATAVRVQRDGVSVGGVVTLRDETQMLTMARQLESVTAMARALRTQRHEFANRLHTVLGLVDTGATDEAHAYLSAILGTGPITTPVEDIDLISDPYLRAVLEAKGTTAAEAGVSLAVAPDSLAVGTVRDPEAVTLILGNLIDNAVRAAVAGQRSGRRFSETGGRVEVQVLSSGTELHAVVTDTGDGIDDELEEKIFDEGFSTAASAQDFGIGLTTGTGTGDGHGLGIGLALSRRVAERGGGAVWLIDGHDPELGGASFGMRLPDALDEPAGDDPDAAADDDGSAAVCERGAAADEDFGTNEER